MSLIGEVFNLYNKANLTGYSGDLTSAAFGQPTSRATQVTSSAVGPVTVTMLIGLPSRAGPPPSDTNGETDTTGAEYWLDITDT